MRTAGLSLIPFYPPNLYYCTSRTPRPKTKPVSAPWTEKCGNLCFSFLEINEANISNESASKFLYTSSFWSKELPKVSREIEFPFFIQLPKANIFFSCVTKSFRKIYRGLPYLYIVHCTIARVSNRYILKGNFRNFKRVNSWVGYLLRYIFRHYCFLLQQLK